MYVNFQRILRWFIRGNANPTETANFSLDRYELHLPGGTSDFNAALHWLSVCGISLILRDSVAIKTLYDYHLYNFEGTYNHYHITLARALMVFDDDPNEAQKLLTVALDEACVATLFPERGRIKGIPLVQLAEAVLFEKKNKIVNAACDALRGHYAISRQASDNYLAHLYISY
ncbi:hypothetical protein [Agarilytica rhodophyticola]|uniref:hypothetical protein n=1 Tax=Agarilytica rhodophyticola TaxID=1737490 RepID=UPI000B34247C|nr:hypothetical protein [Agarilytica rhodophyticola]